MLLAQARLMSQKSKTQNVIDMFKARYGDEQLKKHYSVFDAAVEIDIAH
jgi:hypothetical protein